MIELAEEFQGNFLVTNEVVILNAEFLEDREDLENLPRIALKLLELLEIESSVVYGIRGGVVYIAAAGNTASLRQRFTSHFGEFIKLRLQGNLLLGMLPLGIAMTLNRERQVRIAEEAMSNVFSYSKRDNVAFNRLNCLKNKVISRA